MKKLLALGLALGLGLLFADVASAQIRLGVGGPMTGSDAAFGAQLRQGVEQGAEPLLYAATSPDALNGVYYGPSRVIVGPTMIASPPRAARDREVGERLFSLAEDLTGVSLPS